MAEVAKGIIDIEINTGSAASALQALQAQINAFNLALNKSNTTQGKFSAEYGKALQQAINKTGLFTAETIRLQTAAATLDKTLSKGKTSLGQYFSARFNKDGAIAAETMALASERARRLQTQFIATSGAANGFQDALAVRPLAAFSSQMAVAGQRAEVMSSMFKQGTTQLINFGKNVQWAGRQLMVGFTVPLTIFGAVAGKTFMDLEKQAVAFKKVYGDIFTTPAELNQNLEAVKGLASEYTKYGIAVKDTIGLAAQAAAAGRKNADLTDAVSQATRLATLGQMDQNAALETTISLQSAFRLSGQDLADTINFLNMVENQTVVSLQDIAAAIPRVAPVIQGLGGDVKDLTVFLAAMQEGGVDAAEGANALKSGLASLINPTRQATDMLSGMGINLQSIIDLNKGDLMGTVQAFAQALASLDQFSRQQALEQVFGKFQYAKLGALFDNISRKGSQAQQVIATLGYSTEQLASTADKELKTIEESFGVQLTGAVERFKLAIAPIGEIFVKIAIPLVNFATKIAEAFNGLSDGQKQFAAIGAVVIGVVVPAVTMLTGLFLNLVGTLAKMTQGMTLFSKGLITGGPIGAIKALTQSSKYLSLAEMDAAMAAQQLAGANEVLNATLVKQVGSSNAAATAIGNLTKAYAAMIATQNAAASTFPASFGVAGASGAAAKTNQVRIRGIQRRNAGGPIFMSNGTTVPGTGNTDTVPAMLTPGEFVVNKEATKNNLGLLHNINDTKKPQGLNAGGKAKGIQYLMAGQLVRGMFMNVPGGFGSLGSQVARGISTTLGTNVAKKSSSLAMLPTSFRNQIITKRKLKRSEFGGANKPGTGGTSGRSGSEKMSRIGPAAGEKGFEAYSKNDVNRIIGPEFDRFGGASARQDLLSKLFKQPGEKVSRSLFGHAGSPAYYEHARKIGLRDPGNINAYPRGRVSQLEGKLFNFNEKDLEADFIIDVLPKTGAVLTRKANSPMARSGADKSLFDTPKWYDELELIEFLQKENVPTVKIREIAGRVASNKKRLISESDKIPEARWGQIQQEAEDAALLYLNAGGQVPGMQYFAANNRQRVVQEAYKAASGIRRRVRPGRDQRFSQQAVLKDYVHDANFVRHNRDPEDMNTLLSMMKPLTQKTRATRGTVLGSTNNPELPYAQQKRIVAAIKEGRYEDLFGMRLNFRGPGSYTTRRETDFSPFIGDLSNPTLRSFSDGFMTLKNQKEEISKLRKIMRSGKFKKLTPGTAEYARALGMTGLWSPARSFRPGANPTIGSDWTVEQVLANKLRDYNNRKKGLNKAFPDKKIQQLLIDEMVGSGALAIDVPKAFYKHPRLPYRGDHIENLVKKENEILLGDRTSQITGVASDLRTRLPSLITQSFNRGNIVPGMGNTDTVPAMLTPGEFVVNKESTKKNYDLLTAINGSQKLNKGGMAYKGSREAPPTLAMNYGGKVEGYAKGGLIGKAAGALPLIGGIAAFPASQEIASSLGIDNQLAQLAAGMAASSAAEKVLRKSLSKFGLITEEAASKTGLVSKGLTKFIPALGSVAPALTKFAGPVGIIVTAGIALKALGDSVEDSKKASVELTNAMFGSAERTKAMGDAFGKESFATASRKASVESAIKSQISPEAQQASSEFMKTDAAKQMLADIELIKKSGGDAALAIRNQLASSIIAGVISPEEAAAIASDLGTALNDTGLSVRIAGSLTKLIGKDGEDLLKNAASINAEITPQINEQEFLSKAQQAYDKMNPFEKMQKAFFGGEEAYKQESQIAQISNINAQALQKEAEARSLLNLAFQEGAITLEEYNAQILKINESNKKMQIDVEGARASALGFASAESLGRSAQAYQDRQNAIQTGTNQKTGKPLTTAEAQAIIGQGALDQSGKKALESLAQNKDAFNQQLIDMGMDKTLASQITKGIQDSFTSSQIVESSKLFGKILAGEISVQGGQALSNMISSGEIDTEAIDRVAEKISFIENIPSITKNVQIEALGEVELSGLYSIAQQIEAFPDPITKTVLFETLGFDLTADQVNQFMALDPVTQKDLVYNFRVTLTETTVKNAEQYTGGNIDVYNKARLQADKKANEQAANDFKNSIGDAFKNLTVGSTSTPSSGSSGKSAVQTLKEYIAEFKKATQAKINYFKATVGLLGAEDQEILALIDTERYLKANITQRNKLLELAKKQLNIQKAVAFLSLSSQEKELQALDTISKTLDIKSQKDQEALRIQQRNLELNNRALDDLSEKEDDVNKVYDERIEAIDKVSKATDRLAQKQQDQISLASSLASGDIAGAASSMSQMTAKNAQNQLEDAKSALERQREEDIKNLTVSVNGILMTRTQILDANKLIEDQILIIEDKLYLIEEERFKLAQKREKLEMAIYLLQLRQTIEALRAQGLSGNQLKNLQALIDQYNAAVTASQAAGVATPGAAANTSLGAGGGSLTNPAPIVAEGSSTGTGTGAASGVKGVIPGDSLFNQMIDMYEKLTTKDKSQFNEIVDIGPGQGYKTWIAKRASKDISNKNLNFVIEKILNNGKVGAQDMSEDGKVSFKKFTGGIIPGIGSMDSVSAKLTPGEFVVRKAMVGKYGLPLLEAINMGSFNLPKMQGPKFDINGLGSFNPKTDGTKNTETMYNNTYNVNVNVAGTDSSPDDIARVVMDKISQIGRGNLRSSNY